MFSQPSHTGLFAESNGVFPYITGRPYTPSGDVTDGEQMEAICKK